MSAAVVALPPPPDRRLPVSVAHRLVVPELVGPVGRQSFAFTSPFSGERRVHGAKLGHRGTHDGPPFASSCTYTIVAPEEYAANERQQKIDRLEDDARAFFAREGYPIKGTVLYGRELEVEQRLKNGKRVSVTVRLTPTLDDDGMPSEVRLTRPADEWQALNLAVPQHQLVWRANESHDAEPAAPIVDLDTYIDLWDRVRFASALWAQYETLSKQEEAEAFFAAHGKEMDAETDRRVARILAGIEPEPQPVYASPAMARHFGSHGVTLKEDVAYIEDGDFHPLDDRTDYRISEGIFSVVTRNDRGKLIAHSRLRIVPRERLK